MVARVLVEAEAAEVAAVVGALEVAEVEVLAEAVVAAVAVKPSQGPRTDCGPIEGGDAERLEKVIPLAGRDQYGSIPLYLNSPGGSVKAAFDMVKVGWTGKNLAHLWPQEIVGNRYEVPTWAAISSRGRSGWASSIGAWPRRRLEYRCGRCAEIP